MWGFALWGQPPGQESRIQAPTSTAPYHFALSSCNVGTNYHTYGDHTSVSVNARLARFRRQHSLSITAMSELMGMTSREYRSLERGITTTLPLSILPGYLTGIERRLTMRATSAAYRARKNEARSKSRAEARHVSQPKRSTLRDSL